MAETRQCERCGKAFEPKREHARFCSARCRVAWNRENWSQASRDRAYQDLLAGRTVGGTFSRTSAFLDLVAETARAAAARSQ